MKRISVETRDAVALIRLAVDGDIFLDNPMCIELDEATAALAADMAVRVVVITGANDGVFVRHYSVVELVRLSEMLRTQGFTADENAPLVPGPLDRVITRLETMPKPVIAAINGDCMGGGFEFSLGCDIRVARRGNWRLGQPESAIGILPGGGGTQRLPRAIGMAAALEHMLMGDAISPDDALRLSFVHELSADPLASAMERARRLAERYPPALAHIKRLAREALNMPLAEGLRLERNLFLDLAVADEPLQLMKDYVAGKTVFTRRV